MEIKQQAQRHSSTIDQFNLAPAGGTLIWDVLTVFVWLGMVSVVMMFATLMANPTSRFNPFPPVTPMPPTLVAAIQLPTPTHTPMPETPLAASMGPTSRSGRATRTPTASPTPVTPTATPTRTPLPTETPTPGPSPTNTVYSLYPFKLMDDNINYIAANTFPNHDTCRIWVAGRVYDLSRSPVVGIVVRLGGYLGGTKNINSLTGTATDYGPSGYEIQISDIPANSSGDLWVQLFGQGEIPLSGRVYFDTFDDCSRNLILINFEQVR